MTTWPTGLLTLAGVAGAVVALVRLHLIERSLPVLGAAVSEYGVSSNPGGYRVATILLGTAGLSAAAGLRLAAVPRASGTSLVLLLVFGVLRLAISWVPMDPPGTRRTPRGVAHNLMAIATFSCVAAAACTVGLSPAGTAAGGWFPTLAAWSGTGMSVCGGALAATAVSRRARRLFGLFERLLYLGIIVWLVVVGLRLIVSTTSW